MAVKKWSGPQAEARIRQVFARNLTAAADVVKSRAKVLLSLPGTARAIKAFSYHYGGEKRNVKKRGLVYGAVVSEPGEPPRKQFGRLRSSVAREVDRDKLTARVGTNVLYGRWLELGTAKMAARPWLRRALLESQGQVKALLARRPPGI